MGTQNGFQKLRHKNFEDSLRQLAYSMAPQQQFSGEDDVLGYLQQKGLVDIQFRAHYDLLKKLKADLAKWMNNEHFESSSPTSFYFVHQATGCSCINFQEAFSKFISLEKRLRRTLIEAV